MPPKKKSCNKDYCEKVFLPEREKVEAEFAKDNKIKYVPLDKNPNKELAKLIKGLYITYCTKNYCHAKCGFAKTVSEKRKKELKSLGAESACEDLKKKHGKYYKNKKV
jgi:hypothetical protein